MRSLVVESYISLAMLGLLFSSGEAASILMMNQPGRAFDDDLIAHFESRGHTVDVLDTGPGDPDEQIDAAESHDLVFISESLGSATLTDGIEAFVKDVETPLIVGEAFVYDDLAMTGDVIHEDFGNTFRVDPPVVELQDGQDSLAIADPNHPMAAGLSGTVQVYEDIYSLNFGLIETMGPGATVIGTIDAAPDHTTLFVYDKGTELEDGSAAAGIRIGIYLGQGAGDPQWDNLHPNGIALLDAATDYALGLLQPGGAPALMAGDSDQDLKFDQRDLVQVQIAAKYLTGEAATWGQGDWNGAPGGEQGSPPPGDGLFNQVDIIAALGPAHYLTGPYAAVAENGSRGDEQASIVYNPGTGELAVDAPASTELTSINIDSAAAMFTGAAALNLGGSFDNDSDNNIFKATFGSSFGSLSFGNVGQTGLTKEFVLNDLTVIGSLAGGGDLGDVDLIYVPEPSSALLMVIALLLAVFRGRFFANPDESRHSTFSSNRAY